MGLKKDSRSKAIFPLPIWIIYLKLQRSLHSFEMINSFVSVCKKAYRKLFSIEILKEGIQMGLMHSVPLTEGQLTSQNSVRDFRDFEIT